MTTSTNAPSGGGSTGRPTGAHLERSGISAGHGPKTQEYGHERLPVGSSGSASRKRRGRGPGRLGLIEILGRLSPRDISVLDLISDHRFLTTHLVEQFCFHDHQTTDSGARTARRVLARLERDSLIARPIRRVGGMRGGSGSSIWMLTSSGQRLRGIRAGRGAVGKVRAPGERFIAHYLAIAETRLALVQAERAGELVLLQAQIEPWAWRNFNGLGGSSEVLKPDMAVVTANGSEAEYEDHWFIEVDRGTESLPTLLKQCERYEAYRRSGAAQADLGVFPIIVWVVPDERRANNLSARLKAARGVRVEAYRVTTPDGFVAVITGGAA